jgi:hypothetical protein
MAFARHRSSDEDMGRRTLQDRAHVTSGAGGFAATMTERLYLARTRAYIMGK